MIAAAALAALLVASGIAWADSSTSRHDLLRRQLARTVPSRMQSCATALVTVLPDECTQLALDLIVYRWRLSKDNLPPDVTNMDIIVSALQTALNNPTVNWTAQLFSVSAYSAQASVPRPANDPRIDSLSDLKAEMEAALEEKESHPIRAAESLGNAARLCQDLSLEMSEAYVCKDLGDHYQYNTARYRQAESFYDRASRPFQDYGCAASNARVHDDWGYLLTCLGKYADAAEHHIQAARQWEQLIREDPRAYKYLDMAGIQYIKAGKAKEAAGDAAGAVDLMVGLGHGLSQLRNYAIATKSYDTLVTNQITVALFMRERLNNPSSALTLLNEAQKWAKSQDDRVLVARVFDELAKTYAVLGQVQNRHAALLKRNSALKEAGAAGENAAARWAKLRAAPAPDAQKLIALARRGATAYEELPDFGKAADLWKRTADMCGDAKLADDQIRCLERLAACLDSQRKSAEALEVRRQAVSLAKKPPARNAVAADIIMAIIESFREQNDVVDALEGYKELEPFVVSTGNSRQIAEMLESRGKLLAGLGRDQQALAVKDFQAAVDKYTNQVGDLWAAGQASLRLAETLRAARRVDDAAAALAAALDKIEGSYGFESTRSSAYRDHNRILQDMYAELTADYVRGGKDAAAVECLKKARYPWLSDLMAELRSSTDPAVAKFANNSELLSGISDSTGPADTQLLLARDPAAFVKACWKLQRDYQSAYNSLAIRPLDLFGSRASIPKDTAVVAYMPTESSIYAFVCGRDMSVCRRLDAESVGQLVAKLRRTLEYCEQNLAAGVPVPPATDWRSPGFLEIKELLAGLYQRLILPLQEDFGAQQQLVFVLPKDLAGLPMQALVSGEQDGQPRFLIQDYRVSYLAGGMLDDLVGSDSREVYPSLDVLAIFADPEDNLPGAKLEAGNIKTNYLNSRWYVGKDKATVASFLAELKQAGLLHIAAHHKTDAGPLGFELLLAPGADSDGEVGISQLTEISNPNLQLVVLSACDTVGSLDPTAAGALQAVEVFSLAGAKSVLGASWKVSDDAASQVFTDFYRHLNRGKSRAEALQLAQLSMIESKQFAHPFYWGCFSLYGNPR